jgi:hypothetical protein
MLSSFRSLAAASSAALLLGACADGPTEAAHGVVAVNRAAGFVTSEPAQARAMNANLTSIRPLISTGDVVPGSALPYSPIPDGLGAYFEGGKLIVWQNFELSSAVTSNDGGPAFRGSRIARLVIDPKTMQVESIAYDEDGSGGFLRFCSGSFSDVFHGFPSGAYMTGEENGATVNGSVVMLVNNAGVKRTLPHLGAYSHENQVALPAAAYGKIVTFGTDDTNGASELYMYVADNESDYVAGNGKLYVFKSDSLTASGRRFHAGNLTAVGQSVPGYFVEITDPADLAAAPLARAGRLQTKVDALGAFPFVRLEDLDYDKNAFDKISGAQLTGRSPAIYFVDTGSPTTTGRTAVNASCGGTCDAGGSLYRVELNPADPTGPGRLFLLYRSAGFQAGGLTSPDNIATNGKGIMVNEDPAYAPAFGGWDGSRNPGVWWGRFSADGRSIVGSFTKVAEVTQSPANSTRCDEGVAGCWETSGIISLEKWMGAGSWAFVVQAHTLPFKFNGKNYPIEGGQLIFMRHLGS